MRQPATEPLYDTKTEEDIFYELSERMGILAAYNEVINNVLGFTHKPELMLEPDKKYTDKEIARRRGLLWNDKDIDWYIEHGHSVTERRADKWYRPWEGMRLHFYIEDMVKQRDILKAKMEAANVPFRHEWSWDDYQPLPTTVLDPVHIALILNPKTAEAQGLVQGDIVQVNSPYGRIFGRIGTSEGMHPDTLGVSNALSSPG